jgi:hypothetical protein
VNRVREDAHDGRTDEHAGVGDRAQQTDRDPLAVLAQRGHR